MTSKPFVRTTCDIEAHASKIYTHKVMKSFGEEVAGGINYISEIIEDNDSCNIKVSKCESGTRACNVEFNRHNQTFVCTCHMYERLGIICRHGIRVLMVNNIFEIPSHYIMKRWTKDVMIGVVLDANGKQMQGTSDLPRSIRFNEVCQVTRELAEHASESVELHAFIMFELLSTLSKVKAKIGGVVLPDGAFKTPCSSHNENMIADGHNGAEVEGHACYNILEPLRHEQRGDLPMIDMYLELR
ncbi:protein FAR1-RELATED SEQUENCE 5-like [Amborella trichopoda]|uniref:protein FAR1-RELATED SEQUENCE 5-like n=1 Tax=Amborella trichopoda TaxID=13333 RepID=UPI0005D4612F|nr:protein FAR1-RELATED SEQUENCE 5-like [Amborella trichopoda]|eukprot:XP_011625080.1 protein FAR1-RELATED SEQUENCE 5-like [Amborella trichopoda]